jgi:cbb3-type cytochrome oxidase cytochrome c subunit
MKRRWRIHDRRVHMLLVVVMVVNQVSAVVEVVLRVFQG